MLAQLARGSATPAGLLLQHELLLLHQSTLAGGGGVPAPVPEGVVQPGPPRGATAAESLVWYGLQQTITCATKV